MNIERWLNHRWYGSVGLLWLLYPLELLYRFIIARKRRSRQLQPQVSVPVIVVGNISAGGTGKTPTMMALIAGFERRGKAIGVVSRGYGRASKGLVEVDQSSSAEQVGDEPLMLHRLIKVPVVVCEDRSLAVQYLAKRYSLDLILADDGMQHYGMYRDLELAVVDTSVGFGNRHCLPLGPLREPVERLDHCDALILNGDAELEVVETRPKFNLVLSPGRPTHVTTGAVLEAKTVNAVAGIGRPQRFFNTLRDQGFEVVEHPFPDHHHFCTDDFANMSAHPIVMTSKDAVKCSQFANLEFYELRLAPELSDQCFDYIEECLNERSE